MLATVTAANKLNEYILQIFVICLHIAVVSLAAEVGNMIFRIITEIQKQNRIEKEQMPVLLADLDELGKDTVYRMTVDSITTESSIMHKSGIDDKKVASNISPEGVFDDDHEANAVDGFFYPFFFCLLTSSK
ncbi:unnamed protein product [Toxocara canis]|uniref:Uncharacterized protein n=1 Tax=Toxocara canis TaxID=6265 RepID=A0A183UMV1_TOXCA|nr:unnamed protein product [Toxocara canis]